MSWAFSNFSATFPGVDGELLLCNSFMGAVARVEAGAAGSVLAAAQNGIPSEQVADPLLAELCRQGFFVRRDARERERVEELLERERGYGFSMIVMPHENCNFRCTYCYESFARGKMLPHVTEGVKKLIARKVTDWRRFSIAWFGGEPLLARDVIKDICDASIVACDRAGIRFSSGMTTNGYFLTPDVADELLTRHVRFFQITVDGPPAEHNRRRKLAGGGPTYDKIIQNLRALRKRDDEFTVHLRVNFDPESLPRLANWIEELAPEFAGDSRFSLHFHPIGRWGGPNDSNLNVCGAELSAQARLDLLKISVEHGFAPSSVREFLSSHGARCYAGSESSMVVGSDGTVYKCTVAFDDHRNHVGRFTKDGELEIDQALWNLWVGTQGKATGKCNDCWFHASCQSRACPLVALESPHQEPPCPSNPTELKHLVQLAVYGRALNTSPTASSTDVGAA